MSLMLRTAFPRLLAVLVPLVNHIKYASLTLLLFITEFFATILHILPGRQFLDAARVDHRAVVVHIEDAADLLIVLLGVVHHRGGLLPLLLKFLLGLEHLFFFISHPLFELEILPFECARRNFVLGVHLLDVLLGRLLPVGNSFLSDLEHLRVVLGAEFLR